MLGVFSLYITLLKSLHINASNQCVGDSVVEFSPVILVQVDVYSIPLHWYIQSANSEHLGCLQSFTIANNYAVNILLHKSWVQSEFHLSASHIWTKIVLISKVVQQMSIATPLSCNSINLQEPSNPTCIRRANVYL